VTTIVQFTDTHISAPGRLHFGHDSAAFLASAIEAVNAMPERPAYALVTGDLVDFGTRGEYDVFREIMSSLAIPYFVIPGNHDDRDVLREVLAPETFGGERGARVRFAIDDYAVRAIALDGNRKRPWPGAALSQDDLAWLERALAFGPERPTIVAVHQPPFSSGLPYLDAFGFCGARALRATLARYPSVGRLIAGHIHHIAQATWEHALATTAPSTVPQRIPLVFAKGKIAGVLDERAGFATHAWDEAAASFVTTFFRRGDGGAYAPAPSS
jgi:3',5'-cyclic AMP phosphodiesterase CpdA